MKPETSDFLAGLPRQPRLLVVDDQAIQIQVLYRALAPDCQVLMATTGEAALRLCHERQPDLVLLDVEMPGMDGFEVLRRLKADPLTLPPGYAISNANRREQTSWTRLLRTRRQPPSSHLLIECPNCVRNSRSHGDIQS